MSEPQYLYHYTSFDGLKGIIDNQNLWLSNRKCVNDTKEFMHSKELIENCITKALSKSTYKDIAYEYRKGLWEIFDDVTNKAYLFSFCDHTNLKIPGDGLLSMWRGYGNEGGYALVFKFAELKKYAHDYIQNLPGQRVGFDDLFKVEYLKSGKVPSRDSSLREKVNLLNNLLDSYFSNHEDGTLEDEQLAFLHLMSRIKHPGFHEEVEYRLCIIPAEATELAQPNLKKHGSSIISYIELPIDPKQLIEKIIIGPQQDIETKEEFLKGYLRAQGLTKIEVKASKIPYLSP